MPLPKKNIESIAFICGGAAVGKNGVGDYTRILKNALQQRGIHSSIHAINDSEPETEIGSPESPDIHRYSSATPWLHRMQQLSETLESEQPDLISIQFVPYSFNPRGIIRQELPALAALAKIASIHVMMHELWLGLSQTDTLKNKLTGRIQRHYIVSLLKKLSPKLIHTSNQGYLQALKRHSLTSALLPIPSNIPIHSIDASTPLPSSTDSAATSKQAVTAIIFGTIHSQWDPAALIQNLVAQCAALQKRLQIIAIGRSGSGLAVLENAVSKFSPHECSLENAGEQSAAEISCRLQRADLGLTSMPIGLLGKSGTHAAMVEHGLPVIATRDDWRLSARESLPSTSSEATLFDPNNAFDLTTLLSKRKSPESRLEKIVDQFRSDLSAAF